MRVNRIKGLPPRLVAAVFTFAVLLVALLLASRILSMRAEYRTADAIRDLRNYLRNHGGEWPSAPSDLGNHYPEGGGVVIDYSLTSERILADPGLLQRAVRPASGKFRTYPHYRRDLESLLAVLRESREPGEEVLPGPPP